MSDQEILQMLPPAAAAVALDDGRADGYLAQLGGGYDERDQTQVDRCLVGQFRTTARELAMPAVELQQHGEPQPLTGTPLSRPRAPARHPAGSKSATNSCNSIGPIHGRHPPAFAGQHSPISPHATAYGGSCHVSYRHPYIRHRPDLQPADVDTLD